MELNRLRRLYIEFFREKKHHEIPGASLIPENDPSVLFTTAGMHPLVPFLMGESHPAGKRLCNVQRCIRTSDIGEVGDPWHLTFFEMMGNWSLGDYFKAESIAMSHEFLTGSRWLNIDPSRLYISVFAGDGDAPRDRESAQNWIDQGISPEHIHYFGKKDNWWGPVGPTGPCGPDTEIFYDTGAPPCSPSCDPSCSCGKYSEIWNNVFMQYRKNEDGSYSLLKQQNVDTGFGLERTAAVLQGKSSVFETEVFEPLFDTLKEIRGEDIRNQDEMISMRIITDHIKAAVFIMGDEAGVPPSNLDQGYIARRLIRRSIRHGNLLGIDSPFSTALAEQVVAIYKNTYPVLEKNRGKVLDELSGEEARFKRTIDRGTREFNKVTAGMNEGGTIPSTQVFRLYDTYGFPLELTREMAKEKRLYIDENQFWNEYQKHQERSRSGAEKRFKGGLADATAETKRLHTATHLLHRALRDVLGDHVQQKGSNITPERLRFDFTHNEKMTPEEIAKVERIVNRKIKENLPILCEEMDYEEAKQRNAIGLFEEKYGEKVKVYSIGAYSREICGGPHADSTGELRAFKILKEKSSSAGIRRIRAVIGDKARSDKGEEK
jgi:alanyl-tRNA synthetase